MRIIEKRSLVYAKNMYTSNVNDFPTWEKEKLKMERAKDRTENQVREKEKRKELHAFLDKMIDFMGEELSQYNRKDLKITFIFER